MRHRRSIRRALLGAAALIVTASAAPASAQHIDRIVAFGDSYADDGNLFEIIGIAPPAPFSTGRFSGGTNYIDTLASLLDVPVENFAIAGALTDNSNTNGPGLPGFVTEYEAFLGGGGGPFPDVDPEFGEGDLLAVSIGANDARFYQQNGGTLAGAAAAGSLSAAQAEAGLDGLVAAGAPTISFLAGDTSLFPEIAGDPTAQAIRQAYSGAFNADIQGVLAGYAANGTIVHYLDGTQLFEQIAADPEAYGLTSAGVCAPTVQCVLDSTHSSQFLFYFDGLHLTSAGFAIVGRYVAAQLQAPLTLQSTSDLGLATARQFGRTLNGRIDLAAPRDGDLAEGLDLFVAGDMMSRDVDADRGTDTFDIDGVGATAGLTYGFGNGLVGLAANYSRPRARFGAEVSETRTDSYQVGAFAAYSIAYAFIQGHAGYGKDEHRITRRGVAGDLAARPDGSHWTAGAKAGWLMPAGAFRAGPVASLDYSRAKVDGYTESGDAVLALNVGDISAKALTGGLGIEARGDFGDAGSSFRPFVAAMAEKDFTGDERTLTFAQTSAPTIVNHWSLEPRSKSVYGRLTGGASAGIFERLSLDALLSTTIGHDQGDELSAHVGLRLGL